LKVFRTASGCFRNLSGSFWNPWKVARDPCRSSWDLSGRSATVSGSVQRSSGRYRNPWKVFGKVSKVFGKPWKVTFYASKVDLHA